MSPKLLSRLNNISLDGTDNYENSKEDNVDETGIDRRIIQNVLTAENPIFNDDHVSSKVSSTSDINPKKAYPSIDAIHNNF